MRVSLGANAPTVQPATHSLAGRTGRVSKPPPQFGQTFRSTVSTHERQNVHSKLQIIAFVASGGSDVAQFSQMGRSSSIIR